MKLKRLGLPKIVALSSALLMVIAGLALSRMSGGREAAAAQQMSEAAAVPLPGLVVLEPAGPSVEEGAAAGQEEGAAKVGAEESPSGPAPEPAAPPASGSATGRKTVAARKPSPVRSLPPLPPPEWGATASTEEPSGPPPGVLWLSGVIQGEEKVAVLRRGENRYVVREGDTFEEKYRVVTISSNRVTLRRGGKMVTLRVGQY